MDFINEASSLLGLMKDGMPEKGEETILSCFWYYGT